MLKISSLVISVLILLLMVACSSDVSETDKTVAESGSSSVTGQATVAPTSPQTTTSTVEPTSPQTTASTVEPTSSQTTASTVEPTSPATAVATPNADTPSSSSNTDSTNATSVCEDEQGPDCSRLRLGDDYHTNSTPQKGYLYSCDAKNANAPGSDASKITWINFVDKIWDFFTKPGLPEGTFKAETGTYTETLSMTERQININNLPVDGRIGDWPMTNYPELADIDSNPGIPGSNEYSFTYPANPSDASSPACLTLGAIGATKNGVVIYSAADARGNDAVAHEIVDVFGGHPAMTNYHYHFIPERLDTEYLSDGHSGIVGYINDGYPIYGYKGENGVEASNADLDECHGHDHGSLGYHYHATIEYPYTVGCYKGTASEPTEQGSSTQSGQQKPPPRK